MCQGFFASLRKKVQIALPGVCEIVMRLVTGDIVKVEAHVAKEGCSDKLLLAYSSALYSNQLWEGLEGSALKNVASVIVLPRGLTMSLGWGEHENKRH